MTSRGKSAVRGFETEIEKSREEGNWKKAIELALQLKQRSPQHESLADFLIGEGKLEAYVEQNGCVGTGAGVDSEIAKGSEPLNASELSASQSLLLAATDEAGRRAGVALDAHLLLAKLHYARRDPAAALQHLVHAELDTLTEKELPIRSLRIVAESYAIKGLCMEALEGGGGGSRYKQAEREAEMVRAFELAAELALLYMQRCGAAPGPLLGAALLHAPALLVRARRPHQALQRYRDMLQAVECAPSAALRLSLARALAELLARQAGGPQYTAPQIPAPPGPWRPRRYAGLHQFVPQKEQEEALLALLVGEALAVRDAVLSRGPEFEPARLHSLNNAVSVIDLLALVASRWGQLCLVLESLERAMKFSFGCAHVWRQRALATAAAVPHSAAPPEPGSVTWQAAVRAMGVWRRAGTLSTGDAGLRLVGARTALGLGRPKEALKLAEEAVRIEEAREGPLRARCLLMSAIAHQAIATSTACRADKTEAEASALKLLLAAAAIDDNDHLTFYHLALQYARQGHLNEAMDACRACLEACGSCAGGLRLCVALWSCACAGRRGARALGAARLARLHYPRADWPLAALAALQLGWEGGDAALATGKELLALVHAKPGPDSPAYAELDALSDTRSDGGRALDAGSIAARTERALSDSASSVSRAGGGSGAGAARAAAWLTLAELCVRLARLAAAAGCVAEAAALQPCSHRLLYTRGVVCVAGGQWAEARANLQDALALLPADVDTLLQLGTAYYRLGWLRLAEKTLRDAAALEPRRADTWRRLSLVLGALGEPLAAADAAAAALQLQPAAPIVPLPH